MDHCQTMIDSSISRLNLSGITLDPEIQPRQQFNQEVIAEYADAMRQGANFPPVVVFYDGTEYWLADGFHRVKAKVASGKSKILVEIQYGSYRDAILYAVGANTTYGLQRSNADKRRAVERLLQDNEWKHWSNREIARRCGVDPKTVNKLRNKLPNESNSMLFGEDCPQIQKFTNNFQSPTQRTVRRKGKLYEMDITKIGC